MPVSDIIEKEIMIPDQVTVQQEGDTLTVEGPNGTLEREFVHSKIAVSVGSDRVRVRADLPKRRVYSLLGCWASHIQNMVDGVTKGFRCNLKIVYSHFPIKTSVQEGHFVIENFIGEKHPRKCRLLGSTKVKISGDQVTVSGNNIEHVMQTAANIEQSTQIRGFDNRVFQDGIYIVERGYATS